MHTLTVIMSFKTELTTGWSFKQHDHEDTPENWLPVASLPSQVHVDLLANNKYVH